MKQCFVSICIPAYEKAAALQLLLESIAIQSFKEYEVIITDDSKTDVVKKVADSFIERLPIKYYRNDPPAGMAKNWNSCIEKASTEWIKIMHDDDWFENENSLQQFVSAAKSTNASFIFSAAKKVDFQTKKNRVERLAGSRKELLEDGTESLFLLNVIGHPSVIMFRKDPEIIFDGQFKWVIDIDFYIRYLQTHNNKYIYIDEVLVNITNDENQVSAGCYKNPYVEIPEYLNLLAKSDPSFNLRNKYFFYCTWELIRRFKIKKPADFARYGYKGSLPKITEAIIRYQKMIPRLIKKQPPWNRRLMDNYFRKIKG